MNTGKTNFAIATLAFLIFLSQSTTAQGDEINFKIAKRKKPYLYQVFHEDSAAGEVALLQWGQKYEWRLRDVDTRYVQSIGSTQGRIFRWDSIVTVSLPATTSYELDSFTITIQFKPGARADTPVLVRRFYIAPSAKRKIRPPAGARGFNIKWTDESGSGKDHMKNQGLVVRMPKAEIAAAAPAYFVYQNYLSADTSVKRFDSIEGFLQGHRKLMTYRQSGSALPADIREALTQVRYGDDLMVKLYYRDENGKTKRKDYYIWVKRRGIVIVRFGGFSATRG